LKIKKVFLASGLFSLLIASLLIIQKVGIVNRRPISKISQLSLQKEALSSLYLCELLELSYDQKIYKEDFEIDSAKEKLLASPLIDEVDLNFINDSHLQVSYKHLTPFARLGDFKNRAVDSGGNIFPIKPFLSPKSIVKIYLGIKEKQGEKSIFEYMESSRWDFAKRCLNQLNESAISGKVKAIDVSKIDEPSLGKNELIVVIEYPKRKDVLRLSKRNYLNEVSNYIILCDKLECESKTLMLDFRFDSCAFIERF
jgi:hypothetical protein